MCESTGGFSPRTYQAQTNTWHQPFDVILSPAGKGKWFPVAGFVNYFKYSGARRVSLLCCSTASGVSVGGLLPALCPHCSNEAGLHPGEGLLQDLVLGVLQALAVLGFAQSWVSPPLSWSQPSC